MSDNNNDENNNGTDAKKTLSLSGAGLSKGTVKQNFSHGRSKSVVVETRKRKIVMPGDKPVAVAVPVAPAPAAPASTPVQAKAPVTQARAPIAPASPRRPKPRPIQIQGGLSKNEMAARTRALALANARQEEDRIKAEADAKKQADLTHAVKRTTKRLDAAKKKKINATKIKTKQKRVKKRLLHLPRLLLLILTRLKNQHATIQIKRLIKQKN